MKIIDQHPGSQQDADAPAYPGDAEGASHRGDQSLLELVAAGGAGPSVSYSLFLELTNNIVGDLGRFAADIDDDRVLVRRGFLQSRKLAVE